MLVLQLLLSLHIQQWEVNVNKTEGLSLKFNFIQIYLYLKIISYMVRLLSLAADLN